MATPEPTALKPGADRREFLAGLAAAFGLAAAGAAQAQAAANPALSKSRQALLTALADTLIPQTDTPGALAAGVHKTVPEVYRTWASAETYSGYLKALDEVGAALGPSFAAAPAAQRTTRLKTLDGAAYGAERERWKGWRELKENIVTAYYWSEPGATRELRFELIPGGWRHDIPVAEVGRAWAF